MTTSLGPIQPLQSWRLGGVIQGSRCCANPSLYDHNPFGVAERSAERVKPDENTPHQRGRDYPRKPTQGHAQITDEQSQKKDYQNQRRSNVSHQRVGCFLRNNVAHVKRVTDAKRHGGSEENAEKSVHAETSEGNKSCLAF